MTLSPEWIASACEGKHAFRPPAQAYMVAVKQGVDHYRCPVCGLWHIGKTR